MTDITASLKQKLFYDLWACGTCSKEHADLFKDRQAAKLIDATGIVGDIDGRALLAAIREREIVDRASDYLQSYPGATIIDLGCGLHTFFPLIDNGIIEWCNVDSPEALDARKQIIEDDFRVKQIACDPLDASWIDQIHFDRTEGLCIIASGFAESYGEKRVKELVAPLAERFGDAVIIFDTTADPFNEMAPDALQLSSAEQAVATVSAWSPKLTGIEAMTEYPSYIKESKELPRKTRSQAKNAFKKGALVIVEAHFA